MKNILTILSVLFLSSFSFGQPPGFDDLKILYADANYEKLVKEAESYTLKDKTKKLIPPYLWLAKGLYKISLSGTDDDKYKNAYKDAIKHLSKGIKYDLKYNEGATLEEEREFMDEFQLSLEEIIENEMSAGGFKKAYGWAISYQKVTTNILGAKFVMGACKFEDQDKPTARTLWQEAQKMMDETESIESWSKADKNMLKIGILYSASGLKKSRQEDKAKALLGKASQWFEEDPDWQEKYDLIVN